jgi:hypothetical protein
MLASDSIGYKHGSSSSAIHGVLPTRYDFVLGVAAFLPRFSSHCLRVKNLLVNSYAKPLMSAILPGNRGPIPMETCQWFVGCSGFCASEDLGLLRTRRSVARLLNQCPTQPSLASEYNPCIYVWTWSLSMFESPDGARADYRRCHQTSSQHSTQGLTDRKCSKIASHQSSKIGLDVCDSL